MPELALRFILGNDDVSTIIPGMRKLSHVESNIAASDAGPLPPELQEKMRTYRWVRKPAPWSQSKLGTKRHIRHTKKSKQEKPAKGLNTSHGWFSCYVSYVPFCG